VGNVLPDSLVGIVGVPDCFQNRYDPTSAIGTVPPNLKIGVT
jgi:hypothetical protein